MRRSKTNPPEGDPTAVPAPESGQTEADERLTPDDVTTPGTAVSEPDVSTGRAGTAGFDSRGKVRRTRAGAWWAGLIVAALLAVGLLIFIAQNSQDATIHYLGFSGQISLAVALLSAAAGGVLLVAIPGAVRMAQLRSALKKNAAIAERH